MITSNDSNTSTTKASAPLITNSLDTAVDEIIQRCGPDIRLSTPLGLGKPAQLINALYHRVKGEPTLTLKIYTALTLERPKPGSGIKGKFLGPIFKRLFDGYVGMDYIVDARADQLPDNIEVFEFFVKSGGFIGIKQIQRRTVSSNYTHIARDMIDLGTNIITQIISAKGDDLSQVSLGCNPELTLNVMRETKVKPMFVGQVNRNMPYMGNDAETDSSIFDLIIDNSDCESTLFATPNMAVGMQDYMIGLYASTLVKDGGTLQIGIGSLGDAVGYALKHRNEDNATYQKALEHIQLHERFGETVSRWGSSETFQQGLYGCSEMFVSGFLYLMKDGIVKKQVFQDIQLQAWINHHPELCVASDTGDIKVTAELFSQLQCDKVIADQLNQEELHRLQKLGLLNASCQWQDNTLHINGQQFESTNLQNPELIKAINDSGLGERLHGTCMHGGFFLGPQAFYQELRTLTPAEMKRINMTDIRYMNHLYGQEELKRQQRQHARFINTTFMAHTLGAATSDALENGQMVSGVGGQYNFVAQAHELPSARSILMIKATREKNGVVTSNIVSHYGNITIPRHLRDIFISEYGIADVRGRCDEDVIKAMLNITDSRFQNGLLEQAKQNGKIDDKYTIPAIHNNNYPQVLADNWAKINSDHPFPAFPFGTDFTEMELQIGAVLKIMAAAEGSKRALLQLTWRGYQYRGDAAEQYLIRLKLNNPQKMSEKIERYAFIGALCQYLGL